MLFRKLIFFHKPVAKDIYYLLFLLYGWAQYPQVLSLCQDLPRLSFINWNPLIACRLSANILNCSLDPLCLPEEKRLFCSHSDEQKPDVPGHQ